MGIRSSLEFHGRQLPQAPIIAEELVHPLIIIMITLTATMEGRQAHALAQAQTQAQTQAQAQAQAQMLLKTQLRTRKRMQLLLYNQLHPFLFWLPLLSGFENTI